MGSAMPLKTCQKTVLRVLLPNMRSSPAFNYFRSAHPTKIGTLLQVVSSLAPARYGRLLKSTDVIDVSPDLFMLRGIPGHIRSDNGPKFNAKTVQG